MSKSETMINHDAIKAWAKKTGARPSTVESTEDKDGHPGILRFDFDAKEDALEEIDWDAFFDVFEDRKLALLVDGSGDNPRFNKLVRRDH
ncbi:hypothetical protein NPA31_015955 [Aurantimonas sp. MSK8Z-1]|uniref:hypothetical protein n=1 Tax=Mangrovibrevibacter kandeliae TaxID=2968473 RepID=UPI002118BA66|nr:hypothetical protein [Aurantimonas sp. MSK8Z-1]MCW4116457.1 hypothetical protein [Aurantimonas sp. MSK8Z-1]